MIRPRILWQYGAIAVGLWLALWLCVCDSKAEAQKVIGTFRGDAIAAVDDADGRSFRTYHRVTVAQLSTTQWTHVEVCGLVTLVKKEADGDLHVRMDDGGVFLVAETVPYHKLPAPRVRQRICVRGISREDRTHHWHEVHPVESWAVQR